MSNLKWIHQLLLILILTLSSIPSNTFFWLITKSLSVKLNRVFLFSIYYRHIQACFVWSSIHTRTCRSTQRKSSSSTRARNATKCHHMCSPSQTRPTDQCSQNARTNPSCARKYHTHFSTSTMIEYLFCKYVFIQ